MSMTISEKILAKHAGKEKVEPGELINCLAILSFSSVFKLTPGDCSPSRSVVSKMYTLFPIVEPHPLHSYSLPLLLAFSILLSPHHGYLAGTHQF
jgi:hypothetical protein